MTLKMTSSEITAFLTVEFPQMNGVFDIISLTEEAVKVRMNITQDHLRPGGTVSGPAMFTLADCAFYYAVLAHVGPEALCVTTNCSIDFMRKPQAGDIIADVRILKLGRNLCVGDVLLYSDGADEPVARANLTYSIPKMG